MVQNKITQIETENAENFLRNIDKEFFSNYQLIAEPLYNENITKEKDVSTLKKPQFEKCIFISSEIKGAAFSNSIFKECQLENTIITNSNCKFSNIQKSFFKNVHLQNTSFEDSLLHDTILNNCKIEGCSFINSILSQTCLNDISIEYCDFEGSFFNNVTIKNVDFRNVGFDYVEFNNVTIKNVIFPFADIFHCINGLHLISEYSDSLSLGFENSLSIISGIDCINMLDMILSFFLSKRDFLAIANIYIYIGEQENAYLSIIEGLKNALLQKDFKLVLYLCKIASYNSFFTQKQLKDFYAVLQSQEIILKLNNYEYKYYLVEMDEIKRLLIDNPFGMPQLVIELSTNILPDDYTNLKILLEKIDEIIDSNLPQAHKYLSLRHNSPDVIELFISDTLSNLIIFMGCFTTIFLGTTKIIKEFQTIIKNQKEIENIELDNLLKKQELEKNKSTQKETGVCISNHIEKVSYHIKTSVELPFNLRQNTYYKKK